MPSRPRTFRTLASLQPATKDPASLRFLGTGGTLEVQVLAPDHFRLLALPPRVRQAPKSWILEDAPRLAVRPEIRRTRHTVQLTTAEAVLHLDLRTAAWSLSDRHRIPVFEAPPRGIAFARGASRVALNLAPRDLLFGLGESTGPFNKRGLSRDLWNIDVLGHAGCLHPNLKSLYLSIPFALTLRDGRAAGLFWDHPARQSWDLGATLPDRWQMTADVGVIDLHLFAGPTPAAVLRRFTELTGRMPLPPRWALGYHQSRYSYESRRDLERIAREFRRRHLPCDVLHCDIHALDGHRVFTFGASYPDPASMTARLARQGFKVVSIVDPGVKDDPRFGVLRRGRAADAFVKDPTGKADARGRVWPGWSRFPDFLRAEVRQWWGDEQAALLRLGVRGFWNDMNEPATFDRPDKTLHPRCLHHTDRGPRRHAEVHNLYGLHMARASREGALRHHPGRRPLVITRSGWAGIQRHAIVWTGDSASCWEHLADTLQLVLNLGLSGAPFVGSDVGGFQDSPTAELFLRWLQMAVFTPFLRNHTDHGTRPQEPWAFGPETEAIARRYLNLRYTLLPHLYGLVAEAARDGTPIVRPLLWHHPGDPVAAACADQFLLGDSLLVAPVLRPGIPVRSVYLPRGEWFDFWTGERHTGAQHLLVPTPVDRLPLFVRAGALIPMTETRPFVGPREPETVFLHLWPDNHARLEWYDDDGLTEDWRAGGSQRREITAFTTDRRGWLRVGPPLGPYRGATRLWRVVVHGVRRRCQVRVDSRILPATRTPETRLLMFDLPVSPQTVTARWS